MLAVTRSGLWLGVWRAPGTVTRDGGPASFPAKADRGEGPPVGESARGTSRPNGIDRGHEGHGRRTSPNEWAENAPQPSRTNGPSTRLTAPET